MNKMMEAECGGSNPLTQLSTQVNMNTQASNSAAAAGLSRELPANQYAPTTFNVQSLLSEVHNIENMARQSPMSNPLQPGPSVVQLAGRVWTNEFGQQRQPIDPMVQASAINTNPFSQNASVQQPMFPIQMMQPISMPQYMPMSANTSSLPSAREILDKIDMQKEEIEVDMTDEAEMTEQADITDTEDMNTRDVVDEWTEEYKSMPKESEDEMWERLQGQWEATEDYNVESYQNWLSDMSIQDESEYKFDDDQSADLDNAPSDNAFEEGLQAMEAGDTARAIQLFEAVVKKDPTHVEGWYNLGNAQSSNEHDIAAISAYLKCIGIDKNHLRCLLALSVSYTNDHRRKKAACVLKAWIQANPKYAHIHRETPAVEESDDDYFYGNKSNHHEYVINLFISAARLSPTKVDVDVQVALGVLYNICDEYGKAIDCFTSAAGENPNDAMLWNKLGASYANNGENEHAISAYKRALNMQPGYIRTRFNLAIALTNLGAYKQSAEQLILVLRLREENVTKKTLSLSSDAIWGSLQMQMSLLDVKIDIRGPNAWDLEKISAALAQITP